MKEDLEMPNRILKESICQSEEINKLTWFEEAFFYRLIVACDDYGRFDGRVKIIKGTCFPLKEIKDKEIQEGLDHMCATGLIRLYTVDDRPYLEMVTWNKHQRIRNQRSKYPSPVLNSNSRTVDSNSLTIDSNSRTVDSNSLTIDSNSRTVDCLNPIQSNTESEYQSESIISSEPKAASEPPVITLKLNDGSEYPFYQNDVSSYMNTYPAVDIMQQFREMKKWCEDNPSRRKTKAGIKRFVNSWLAREQDKYHPAVGQRSSPGDVLQQAAQMYGGV